MRVNEQKLEQFLIEQGFGRAESLDELKVVFNSKGKDLRYFIDKESIGLHISNANYVTGNLLTLKEQLGVNISKLKVLYLGNNRLLGYQLHGAKNLQYLNISDNHDLQIFVIEAPELIECNASFCNLLRYVELKGTFNKLEKLDISFCIISKLILPKNLPKLNYFNLSNNQLSDPSFLKFIAEDDTIIEIDYIFWKNNQFDSFGNTLERHDIELLKDFFIGARDIIYRKKLILLGNTQAGKTTLCDILRDDKQTLADGKSTHGVNVFRYTLEKNKLIQVYDFGGQDFYHNAHLPFYSQNTNFLLVYGNGQEDEYGVIDARDIDRQDDIFPINYWLSSVKANLFPKAKAWLSIYDDTVGPSDLPKFEEKPIEVKSIPVDFKPIFEERKIRLAMLENLRHDSPPNFLNQKDLVDNYGVSDFFQYQLKKDESGELSVSKKKEIKKIIDNWLLNNMSSERLRKDIIQWGEKLTEPNGEFGVIVTKEDLQKLKIVGEITDNEIKLLHDSYALFVCEEKEGMSLPVVLKNSFIVNLGVFTQWLYAILNLDLLQKVDKGEFDRNRAKEYLAKAKNEAAGKSNKKTIFDEAEKHLDFILAFLKYNKMIFQIKRPTQYIVPQYLPKPEEKDTTDVVLLQLFAEPFIRYTFTGFYHTQILTDIIAEYFNKDEIQIAKEEINNDYKYLIWKNKVVLYLSKEDKKLNAKDLLLIQFEICEVQKEQKTVKIPMLILSETGLSSLKESYKKLKTVIDFIDNKIQNLKPIKEIRTPNNTYISANLLKEDNRAADGSVTDLVYDINTKFFYRKGDFPLLIDPAKYPMKKIFISYSKSDVKYRDEFKKHFYPLKRQSKIDTFDDSDLGFGEWNPQILKKIEECDIFVCLVSIDFLNTDYIINTELPHAIKHEKTIVPIKIRECDWSDFLLEQVNEKGEKELNLKLGAYNASLKAKTISLFSEKDNYFDKRINTIEERDAVWTELVNQFKIKLKL